MAGGGMNVGQCIGKLDRHGMNNTGRPVHNHEVLATVYYTAMGRISLWEEVE